MAEPQLPTAATSIMRLEVGFSSFPVSLPTPSLLFPEITSRINSSHPSPISGSASGEPKLRKLGACRK